MKIRQQRGEGPNVGTTAIHHVYYLMVLVVAFTLSQECAPMAFQSCDCTTFKSRPVGKLHSNKPPSPSRDLMATKVTENKAKGETKKKRRTKAISENTLRNSKLKMDVDKLVQSIGLTPARLIDNKKKKHKGVAASPYDSVKSESTNGTQCRGTVSSKDVKEYQPQLVPLFHNVSTELELAYARNGHACFRSLLPLSLVSQLKLNIVQFASQKELNAWRQKVDVATNYSPIGASCQTIADCKTAIQQQFVLEENVPFLQHFNTWRTLPIVRELATKLSSIAAQLLDVTSVRLYQDSIFHKRVGDGHTPWHSDARMAPFDTSQMLTFWVPLQEGPGLKFVDKSHADFALPFWNHYTDKGEYSRLEKRYKSSGVSHYMPVKMGDVTVHNGWTLHSANANNNSNDRYALAITYVDAMAEVREDAKFTDSHNNGDNEDWWSFQSWIQDVTPRSYFEHELVPIVWPTNYQGQ